MFQRLWPGAVGKRFSSSLLLAWRAVVRILKHGLVSLGSLDRIIQIRMNRLQVTRCRNNYHLSIRRLWKKLVRDVVREARQKRGRICKTKLWIIDAITDRVHQQLCSKEDNQHLPFPSFFFYIWYMYSSSLALSPLSLLLFSNEQFLILSLSLGLNISVGV